MSDKPKPTASSLREFLHNRSLNRVHDAAGNADPGQSDLRGGAPSLEQKIAQAKQSIAVLSPLETDILRFMVEGFGPNQIAALTETSTQELWRLRQTLLSKLGADCNSSAIRIGIYAFL